MLPDRIPGRKKALIAKGKNAPSLEAARVYGMKRLLQLAVVMTLDVSRPISWSLI